MRRARTGEGGFTLIEMLVVLVLTALLVTVVFEGLARIADLRVRLARHLDGALDEIMVGSWFRSSVAALQPDLADAPDAFRGSASEMSGLTLKPIDLPAGGATPFGWRLSPDAASGATRLFYRGGDGTWREIASWAAASARFLYAGPDGEWRSEWPPPRFGVVPLGQMGSHDQAQLPRFVRLEGGSGAGSRSVAASVFGSRLPRQGINSLSQAIR
ncbi:MAG: prepilin-type N-terminal cleavage/methylation domain-containing protein [Alphaproteobacteria bacterium]|nr:prepilin-type N-terminal cleavage/methylation domain-containing protein [Alphaproteobacteria bacterium]